MQDLQSLLTYLDCCKSDRSRKSNQFELNLYFKHEFHIQNKPKK